MAIGETCKERSAVLQKDAAPFTSEIKAGIDEDGDDGYRWCDLGGGQRAGHGNSTRSLSTTGATVFVLSGNSRSDKLNIIK